MQVSANEWTRKLRRDQGLIALIPSASAREALATLWFYLKAFADAPSFDGLVPKVPGGESGACWPSGVTAKTGCATVVPVGLFGGLPWLLPVPPGTNSAGVRPGGSCD